MCFSIDKLRFLVGVVCVFACSAGFSLEEYRIVLGSFSELKRAETALVEFRKQSRLPLQVTTVDVGGRELFRLTAGPFDNAMDARRALSDARALVPDAWLDIPALDEANAAALVFGSFSRQEAALIVRDERSEEFRIPLNVNRVLVDGMTLYRIMSPVTSDIASVRKSERIAKRIYPNVWVYLTDEVSETQAPLTIDPATRLAETQPVRADEAAETAPDEQAVEPPIPPAKPSIAVQPPSPVAKSPGTPAEVSAKAPEPAPVPQTVVVDSREKKPRPKSTFVPPGFEDLLEPQTTEVDVYFGSAFVTATLATYTPTEITLLTPAEVVLEMNDLLDPAAIISLLSGPMPTNSELVCLYDTQTGCGELQTESVEVIFDENRFRLDLFLGPSLLAVRDVEIDKFLPKSSGGLAFLNQLNATVNGRESGDSSYNVGNSTTIAFRETRLLALSNVTREEDFTVDTLALEREFAGRLYQAGYFRSSAANLVFLTEQEFAGITMSSSLDTRTDLDQSTGNDLQVFLDSRSRVDLLKDGRLISTSVHDAGNQIVDTSSLPGGAYDIVLRIRDSFGRTREETRFYVKTNELPPLDHTLYFLNIGETAVREEDRTLPRTTGESLIRAGISRRLTRNFGGNIGIMSQEDEQLYELGIFQLGRSYELNLNYAEGNDGDRGVSLNTRFRRGPFTLNANYRKTWIEEDRTDLSLFGTRTTQGSLNISVPIGRAALTVTGRYNERADESADKNIGLKFDFPSYHVGSTSFDSDIQVTEDNDEIQALFTLRLRFDRGNWRNEVTSQYYYDEFEDRDSEDGFINNLSTAWRDGDRFLSDVNWNLRATSERDDDTLETDLEVVSDYGRFNADVIYSDETEELSWGASLHTNLIANRGTISFGGREQARSALVMDVKGDVEDAYFDVLVDGAPRGNARIGSKTVIGIQPYETYEVTLVPKGDSIVDFNNQTQSATLYPGNVVTMEWKAARVIIAFGQLVRANGEPVQNALISGVTGIATTDDFGFFQAEIESDTTMIQAKSRTEECEATLPAFDRKETVVMMGEISCR